MKCQTQVLGLKVKCHGVFRSTFRTDPKYTAAILNRKYYLRKNTLSIGIEKNENGFMIETVSGVVVDLRTFPRLPDILRKQVYDLDLTLNDFCYLNDSTQMP